MKFRVTFEQVVTRQAEIVVEADDDDGFLVRWKARRDFDPKTADWITVDESFPVMAESAEEVTE